MPKGFTKNELMIGIPTLFVVTILVLWGVWYEFSRADDAQTYSQALSWHSALSLYFHVHGVYPVAPHDAFSLQGQCLIDTGFVSVDDKSCGGSSRIYGSSHTSSVLYYPRNANNVKCNDAQGCARYYMTITQKTRAISGQDWGLFYQQPKGLHVFGSEGLLIDQKQVPGL